MKRDLDALIFENRKEVDDVEFALQKFLEEHGNEKQYAEQIANITDAMRKLDAIYIGW